MEQFLMQQQQQLPEQKVPPAQRHHNFRDEETRGGGPKFDPPVYMQRYRKATQYIEEFPGDKQLKIVDFGCAEMGFVTYAKVLKRVSDIVCVDLDYDLLQQHAHLAAPQETDYSLKRPKPLRVRIMSGSAIEWDDVLADTDVVTAIELIEHLHPPVLAEFPWAIFGKIKPKMAVITTPNADFNCLFQNFSQFRHPDHKFEWTRKEFEEWCNNCAEQYGYSCEFSGVGEPGGVGNLKEHGYCSQVAVFHRNDPDKAQPEPGDPLVAAFQGLRIRRERKYSFVAEFTFPSVEGDGEEDDVGRDDRAISLLESGLLETAQFWPEFKKGEAVYVHISRAISKLKRNGEDLLRFVQELNLRELLESFGYDITSNPPADSNVVPMHISSDESLGDFYVGIVKPSAPDEEMPESPEDNPLMPTSSADSISQSGGMPGAMGNMIPVVINQPPFVPFAAALSWGFGNPGPQQPTSQEEGPGMSPSINNDGVQYQQPENENSHVPAGHSATSSAFNFTNLYRAVPLYYINAFPFGTFSCAMVPNGIRCPLPPYFPMSHIYQQYPQLICPSFVNRPCAPGTPPPIPQPVAMGNSANNVIMMPSAMQPNGPRPGPPVLDVTGAAAAIATAGVTLPMHTFRHALPTFVQPAAAPSSTAGSNQQGVFVGASV